jgi:hypothetical protein
MDLSHLRDRLVHADVSEDEFKKRWSKLDWTLRAAYIAISSIASLYFRYFLTRRTFARFLRWDSRKAWGENLPDDQEKAIDEVIVKWRDRHLIQVIDEHLQKYQNSSLSIAIVYGAGHMPAVVHHLTKRPKPGYRVVDSEWITVFTV